MDNKIFNSYPMMIALEYNSTFTDLYQKDLEETKRGGGEKYKNLLFESGEINL